jgi:hypothetical protein
MITTSDIKTIELEDEEECLHIWIYDSYCERCGKYFPDGSNINKP